MIRLRHLFCLCLYFYLIYGAECQIRDYRIFQEKLQAVRILDECPMLNASTWFNGTHSFLSVAFHLKDASVNTWKIWLDFYEKKTVNGQYQKSVITFTTNVCDVFDGKFFVTKAFYKFGVLPQKCPAEVGIYYLRNFYVENQYLPPTLPGRYWRLDLYIGPPKEEKGSDKLGHYQYFCTIERKGVDF